MRARLMLAAVTLACSTVLLRAADRPAEETAGEVEVYFVDQVGLPKGMADAVRDEVREIFLNAGVRVTWFEYRADDPGHPVKSPFVRVVMNWKKSFDRQLFRNKSSERRVLGAGWTLEGDDSIASSVYLPYEDLLWASRSDLKGSPAAPQILFKRVVARVVAHEMGHVLMNRKRHSGSGLMRPDFPPHRLVSPFETDFIFSPEDAVALRNNVKASMGIAQGN